MGTSTNREIINQFGANLTKLFFDRVLTVRSRITDDKDDKDDNDDNDGYDNEGFNQIRGGYLGSCYRHTNVQKILDGHASKPAKAHYTIDKQLFAHNIFYEHATKYRFGNGLDSTNFTTNHDDDIQPNSNLKSSISMTVKTESGTVLIDNQNVWFQNQTFPCTKCCSI